MTTGQLTGYVLIAAALGVFAARWLRTRGVRRQLPDLLRAGAQVVDVRSAAEYAAGHAAGSRNIPLDELGRRAGELDKSRPVVLCCASGARSGIAQGTLRKLGFEAVVNAGSWRSLRPPS